MIWIIENSHNLKESTLIDELNQMIRLTESSLNLKESTLISEPSKMIWLTEMIWNLKESALLKRCSNNLTRWKELEFEIVKRYWCAESNDLTHWKESEFELTLIRQLRRFIWLTENSRNLRVDSYWLNQMIRLIESSYNLKHSTLISQQSQMIWLTRKSWNLKVSTLFSELSQII